MKKEKVANGGSESSDREPLVEFAFRVYAEPKVEELCLHLQNKYQANVNILLWVCWLKAESIKIDRRWLDDVLISVDTLSQLTVARLQEVRRVIKESSGFTRVQSKLINKHILTAELMAEKVFLQRMQDMTLRFLESQIALSSELEEVLDPEYYFEFMHIPNARERVSLILSYSKKADVVQLQPEANDV